MIKHIIVIICANLFQFQKRATLKKLSSETKNKLIEFLKTSSNFKTSYKSSSRYATNGVWGQCLIHIGVRNNNANRLWLYSVWTKNYYGIRRTVEKTWKWLENVPESSWTDSYGEIHLKRQGFGESPLNYINIM